MSRKSRSLKYYSMKLKEEESKFRTVIRAAKVEDEQYNLLQFIDNYNELESLYLELKAFPVEEILRNKPISNRDENIVFQLRKFKKDFLAIKKFIKKNKLSFNEEQVRRVYHDALQNEIKQTVHRVGDSEFTLIDRKEVEEEEVQKRDDFAKNKKIFKKIYEDTRDHMTILEADFKKECEEYENESLDFDILSKKVDQKLIKLSKSIDIKQICEMYQVRRFSHKKPSKYFSYHLKFVDE